MPVRLWKPVLKTLHSAGNNARQRDSRKLERTEEVEKCLLCQESVTSRKGRAWAVMDVKECQPSSGEGDEHDLEVAKPTASRKGPNRAVVEVKEYQPSSGENDDYL